MARVVETNYGDLATDAFLKAGKTMLQTSGTEDEQAMPVIAVENGGGIREKVANGMITQGSLITTFPFANTLYMKKITPAILYEIMEISGELLDGQDPETGMLLQTKISGGFLQIAGFQVVFAPDQEQQKVKSIRLEGQDQILDRNDNTTEILMVSNNYIMNGGNGYSMLAELAKYGEAGGELEIIQAYIEDCLTQGTMKQYQTVQKRIQYTGSTYQPKDYTALVKLVDENGKPLENTAFSYRIDGKERINGCSDDKGFFHITLTDGAHSIRLSDKKQDIYLDNYTGIGLVEDELRKIPELVYLNDGSCAPIITDKEDAINQGNGTESSSNEHSEVFVAPATGDITNMTFVMIQLLSSLCAIIIMIKYQRTKKA